MNLVHIGMATMPKRERACRKVIDSILAQTHEDWHLWVSLNDYGSVPRGWPEDSRITYRLSDNELGDGEKFFPHDQEGSDLLFAIDDDIVYPPDYLEKMLGWFNHFDQRYAIAVHGSILTNQFRSWAYDRWVSHFAYGQKQPAHMHILGTGTVLLKKEWLEGYQFADFRNMSDIGVSLQLRREGVARITVPRSRGWLKPIGGVKAICFSSANLRLVNKKLKSVISAFVKEVQVDDRVETMLDVCQKLPRRLRKEEKLLNKKSKLSPRFYRAQPIDPHKKFASPLVPQPKKPPSRRVLVKHLKPKQNKRWRPGR